MLIETLAQPWRRARRTNYATNGFPSKIPTVTKPLAGLLLTASATTQDAIDSASGMIYVQNKIQIMPLATGADNVTFSVRLYGWAPVVPLSQDPSLNLWVPTFLAEYACTASAFLGVAGTQVVATERFADTITLTTGNALQTELTSPTADLGASVRTVTGGFPVHEIVFTTGGSATDCNALYRFF